MVAAIDTSTCCPSPVRGDAKGGQDADDALKAGVHVGVAACVVARLGERIAEMVLDDVGQARLGLHGRRERRPVAPESIARSRSKNVDHGRIEGADLFIAESEPVQRPGPKILDDDVRVPAQVD